VLDISIGLIVFHGRDLLPGPMVRCLARRRRECRSLKIGLSIFIPHGVRNYRRFLPEERVLPANYLVWERRECGDGVAPRAQITKHIMKSHSFLVGLGIVDRAGIGRWGENKISTSAFTV